MAAHSTSFRLSDEVKQRLSVGAQRHGLSSTALLERLIVEGIDTIEHPGIVYHGPSNDRRAALAAGPDVWEVVALLRGAEDRHVADVARAERRAMVTENIVDYAHEHDLVLVCVLKRNLPTGGAQANALATLLDRWSKDNPHPYVEQHWPS